MGKYANSRNILLRHEQDWLIGRVIEICPGKAKTGMFVIVMLTPDVQKWYDLAAQA